MEECGPWAVFASFTLAFALQLRKDHGKTSVRVRKTSVRVQYTYYQNTHTLQNPHKHTLQNPHKHTLQNPHTRTHTLQNNTKPPQYKLKHTQLSGLTVFNLSVTVSELHPVEGKDRDAQISRQSAHEGGKVVSPMHRPPLTLMKYSWYSFLLRS